MRDFHKLQVWQKSHQLTLDVYRLTAGFPDAERYGLTSQVRRAAVSIAANIAEGCGRNSERDYLRFLHIAFGSANELEYELLLSKDLGYLEESDHSDLNDKVNEVERMLGGLIRSIKAGT